jgi:hypothetical protein
MNSRGVNLVGAKEAARHHQRRSSLAAMSVADWHMRNNIPPPPPPAAVACETDGIGMVFAGARWMKP